MESQGEKEVREEQGQKVTMEKKENSEHGILETTCPHCLLPHSIPSEFNGFTKQCYR